MKILGIETSADDSGIALIEADGSFGPNFRFDILANEVSTQTIHESYGGIFPAMAKREHAKNLPILLQKIAENVASQADVIAVTHGPGLEPCLWTGITFAQDLAKRWKIPVVAVNHMEGHILISMMNFDTPNYSSILQNTAIGSLANFEFPALSLLISGGHTDLILSKQFQSYEYIGRTRDDAVGEAFDKVARLLGLPYPGGPHISKLAEEARSAQLVSDIKLPRPMLKEDNFDFSFAGLKTAVLRLTEKHELTEEFKRIVAREFEDAAADVLIEKTLRAVEEFGARTAVVGGGVSANAHIRKKFRFWSKEMGFTFLVCPPQYSTDNALMIALSGYFHALKKEFTDPSTLKAIGSLRLPPSA